MLLALVILLGASCSQNKNTNNNILPGSELDTSPLKVDQNTSTAAQPAITPSADSIFGDINPIPVVPTSTPAAVPAKTPLASTSTPVTIQPIKPISPVIGGQVDGYGCLSGAGYSHDNDIKVCLRSWEAKDADIRRAIKLAVDYYLPTYSLTVASIIAGANPGDYTVVLQAYGQRTTINIVNWEVQQ